MTTLYHYTCGHSAAAILREGYLRPHWTPDRITTGGEPACPPVVWLTDLPMPDADALGLSPVLGTCDRTEHRFTVQVDDPVRWKFYAREHGLSRRFVRALERGRRPYNWFVSTDPVQVGVS